MYGKILTAIGLSSFAYISNGTKSLITISTVNILCEFFWFPGSRNVLGAVPYSFELRYIIGVFSCLSFVKSIIKADGLIAPFDLGTKSSIEIAQLSSIHPRITSLVALRR